MQIWQSTFADNDSAITLQEWETFVENVSQVWEDGASDWIDELQFQVTRGIESNDIYKTPERIAKLTSMNTKLNVLQETIMSVPKSERKALLQESNKLDEKIAIQKMRFDFLLNVPEGCELDPIIPNTEPEETAGENDSVNEEVMEESMLMQLSDEVLLGARHRAEVADEAAEELNRVTNEAAEKLNRVTNQATEEISKLKEELEAQVGTLTDALVEKTASELEMEHALMETHLAAEEAAGAAVQEIQEKVNHVHELRKDLEIANDRADTLCAELDKEHERVDLQVKQMEQQRFEAQNQMDIAQEDLQHQLAEANAVFAYQLTAARDELEQQHAEALAEMQKNQGAQGEQVASLQDTIKDLTEELQQCKEDAEMVGHAHETEKEIMELLQIEMIHQEAEGKLQLTKDRESQHFDMQANNAVANSSMLQLRALQEEFDMTAQYLDTAMHDLAEMKQKIVSEETRHYQTREAAQAEKEANEEVVKMLESAAIMAEERMATISSENEAMSSQIANLTNSMAEKETMLAEREAAQAEKEANEEAANRIAKAEKEAADLSIQALSSENEQLKVKIQSLEAELKEVISTRRLGEAEGEIVELREATKKLEITSQLQADALLMNSQSEKEKMQGLQLEINMLNDVNCELVRNLEQLEEENRALREEQQNHVVAKGPLKGVAEMVTQQVNAMATWHAERLAAAEKIAHNTQKQLVHFTEALQPEPGDLDATHLSNFVSNNAKHLLKHSHGILTEGDLGPSEAKTSNKHGYLSRDPGALKPSVDTIDELFTNQAAQKLEFEVKEVEMKRSHEDKELESLRTQLSSLTKPDSSQHGLNHYVPESLRLAVESSVQRMERQQETDEAILHQMKSELNDLRTQALMNIPYEKVRFEPQPEKHTANSIMELQNISKELETLGDMRLDLNRLQVQQVDTKLKESGSRWSDANMKATGGRSDRSQDQSRRGWHRPLSGN